MRTLPILAAVTVAAAETAVAQQAPKQRTVVDAARCRPTTGIADYRDGQATVRKLGEMPPASQIYTVFTVVDGCPRPVLVSGSIGGDPRRQTSPTRSPPRATKAH